MPPPRFKVTIEYTGKKSFIFQHPTIETVEQAGEEAHKFFEKGEFSKGPLPNNCLPVGSRDYIEDETDDLEDKILATTVTQLSHGPADCVFCGEDGKFKPASKCFEHCHMAEDGRHQPDPTSIRPQDPPDPIEDGKFIADINCKICGKSTGVCVDLDDISWD